jgi:cell division protein FtsI/penicillin-binding protein 2
MKKLHLRTPRYDIVFIVIACVLILLGVRLGQMVYSRYTPATEAEKIIAQRVDQASGGQKITLTLAGRPGNIYASSLNRPVLMAGSRQVPSCFIDPKIMTREQLISTCEILSNIFSIDLVELRNKLLANRNSRFLWVYREMTNEQEQTLRAEISKMRKRGIRGVGLQYEWRREYPNGKLGGTVLGFCLKDNTPGGGLELKLKDALSAKNGKRVLWGDVRRRGIWPVANLSVQPIDGGNVYLTLDAVIQGYLQTAVAESVERFGAKWGTGIVVNPQTGDILAMCSMPTFDPNLFNTTPAGDMLNRAATMPFEPGSVFKPIIAAQAVQEGLLSFQSMIDCENGVYNAPRGGRISDHGQNYQDLSLWDVVVVSSNIGMAKVGEVMGNKRLWKTVRHWGFGQRTRLGLPGETPGIVRPLQKWDGYSLRRIPFGQEISTSALQLIMGFSVFANGGNLMVPNIVRKISDPYGKVIWESRPTAVRRILSPQVAGQALEVLQDVVENPKGTGKNCRMENWTSWGKTGTAQISSPQGYMPDAYVGSFIGGAPAKKPAIVCLISIYFPDRQKGYYGGTVAAPYVKDVLEKTLTHLQIPSDR